MRSGSTQSETRQSLAHVLWMGGSPCSGKSSIAKRLASRYGLALYRCDDAFWEHMERAEPDRHPRLHKLNRMTWDEIWMRPVDAQIADETRCYHEEFEMILDDLLAYPRSTPVLAEGADRILGPRSPNFVYRPTKAKRLKLLLKIIVSVMILPFGSQTVIGESGL